MSPTTLPDLYTLPVTVTRRAIRIVVKSAVADARRHITNGLNTCGNIRMMPVPADSADGWEWVIRHIEPETIPAETMIAAMIPAADEAGVSRLTDIYHDAYIEESFLLMHILFNQGAHPYGIDAGRNW